MAQLKQIRPDGKRFPPSWSANEARGKVAKFVVTTIL
jgi:hypothetical protein